MEYYWHELYTNQLRNIVENRITTSCFLEKRIVVTGARGLIGSMLIDVLMYANRANNLNCKIYAVVRNEEKAKIRFADYLNEESFQLVVADINEAEINIEGKIDYFIHGASNTHPQFYATKPIDTLLTNTIGTNRCLDFAAAHRCNRFLFLSSVEIYGENRSDVEVFDENYCGYINCNTLRAGYPEGKRAGESLCQAYRKERMMDIVILRVARCYGPGLLEEDSKALSQFIKKAVAGEDIVLKSEGNQFYSYIYVADVADALIFLLTEGKDGEAYNVVGNNSDVTLAHLANTLAKEVGTKVVYEIPNDIEKAGYSKATKAVMSGAKLNALGWNARYSLEDGIGSTLMILKDCQHV